MAWLGLVLAATWAILRRSDGLIVGFDDANIYFTYARNLARGLGLVYSAGGERVEGFTSPLWMLVLAPFFRFSASPERLIFTLNLVMVAAALTALGRALGQWWGEHAAGRRPWAPLAALAVWSFLAPEFFSWSVISLMETGLWLLLNTLFFIAALRPVAGGCLSRRHAAALALVAAALMLARPESVLFVPAVLAYVTLCLVRTAAPEGAVSYRRLAAVWLAPLAALAVLIAFRRLYFGYWLPNTYYAKVSPSRLYNLRCGLQYLGDFLSSNPLVGFSIVAGAAGLVWGARTRADRQAAAWGLCSLFVLLPVFQVCVGGGDHFQGFRFFQPYWPFFLLVLALGWAALRPVLDRRGIRLGRLAGVAAALLALVVVLGGVNQWLQVAWTGSPLVRTETHSAQGGREVGEALNRVLASHPALDGRLKVGVITAGGIAVTYRGQVFDMMGLNHVAMAHSPGDRHGMKNHAAFNRDVFWRERPDLVLPQTPIGQALSRDGAAPAALLPTPAPEALRDPARLRREGFLKGLEFERAFRAAYVPACLPVAAGSDLAVFGWCRRDVLDRFARQDPAARAMHDKEWLAGAAF